MNLRIAPAVFALAAIVASCTSTPVDQQMEGQTLMQLSRDWSQTMVSGDTDAIMAFWAEDAVMMPPGIPPLDGEQAIRRFLEAATQLPGFQMSWEPVRVHVASNGDMAYMIERHVSTANDSLGNPVTTYGKAVTIWQKDADGSWKNVVYMWNKTPAPGE